MLLESDKKPSQISKKNNREIRTIDRKIIRNMLFFLHLINRPKKKKLKTIPNQIRNIRTF